MESRCCPRYGNGFCGFCDRHGHCAGGDLLEKYGSSGSGTMIGRANLAGSKPNQAFITKERLGRSALR